MRQPPFSRRSLAGMALAALLACGSIPGTTRAASAQGIQPVATIGISLPLVEYHDLSLGIKRAVQVAVAQANNANLVPGVTFQIRVLDDTINGVHDPMKDASNARALIGDPTVFGEIGPLDDSAAAGSEAIYNNAQLAQISPANIDPALTDPSLRSQYEPRAASGYGPITYFRTISSDAFQGAAAALYAAKVLHVHRVYVTDNQTSYGIELARGFQAKAMALGLNVLGYGELNSTQYHFGGEELASLINSQTNGSLDLVYFGGDAGIGNGGAYLTGALLHQGLHVLFMGGDGLFANGFLVNSANTIALGAYATSPGPYLAAYKPAQPFLAAEAAMFPRSHPSLYDVEAYDAAQTLITAYSKAASAGLITVGQSMTTGVRGVLASLVSHEKFQGASGAVSFDGNGDIRAHVYAVYKVANGAKSAIWSYAGQAPLR